MQVFGKARFLVVMTLVGAAGCQLNTFGDAIGRKAPAPYVSQVLVGVDIVEVYPAASGAFVELLGAQLVAPLDLSAYELVSQTAVLPLSGILAIAGRVAVPADALDLPRLDEVATAPANIAQSGEVALVETATGIVHSYFAWGTDPGVSGSGLYARSVQSGAAKTSALIDVPFPRLQTTSIVHEGDIVGCTATPTAGTPPGNAPCATAVSPLILREVGPANDAASPSWVEIQNRGVDLLDIGNVRVCHDGQCGRVPPSTFASVGGVYVGCFGAKSAAFCSFPLGTSDVVGDSETFLANPGSAKAVVTLLDYMRTKLAGTTYTAIAEASNLWADSAAPTGTYVPGESLTRNPGVAVPPVWNPALATPEATNPTIDRTTNWQSCAEPAGAASSVVSLVAASFDRGSGKLSLVNDGSSTVDVAAVLVLVDGIEILAAGASLSGSLVPHAGSSFIADIDDSGKLEIYHRADNALMQFAQWGNPASGVTAAVSANLWPAVTCLLPRIPDGASLDLRDGSLVRGSGGYQLSSP